MQLALEPFLQHPGTLLDVRSPAEYVQGSLPTAHSFSLFSDAERAVIGTLYKQQGRQQAVEAGLAYVGPRLLDMVQRAKQVTQGMPPKVYCWRGGMRSASVCWLLQMVGLQPVVLEGGYKTFRRSVLRFFESLADQEPSLKLLGGFTGVGKTEILHALAEQGEQVLDLEALAAHRGSSYGNLSGASQPTTEQFENQIAWKWRQFTFDRPIWIEDESRLLGSCKIPDGLFSLMRQAPVIVIEKGRKERIAYLSTHYGNAPREALLEATQRLVRRVGGALIDKILEQIRQGQLSEAIGEVLDYYDKTYATALKPRQQLELCASGMTPRVIAETLIKNTRLQAGWSCEVNRQIEMYDRH